MKTMNTSIRFNSGYRIRIVLIVTMILLGIYSSTLSAQGLFKKEYFGFVASFGNRSFNQNSSIKAIDNARYGHIGGSLGLVYGNQIMKTRLNAFGYYCSDNNNPHTQDIYESSVTTNFYPLELLRTKRALIHPYISAGFSRTAIKYFGAYLDDNSIIAGKDEPLLGKVLHYNLLTGIGIEMRLETDRDFVHFFAEGVFEKTLSRVTSQKVFNHTSPEKIASFNIGVAFGRKRFN